MQAKRIKGPIPVLWEMGRKKSKVRVISTVCHREQGHKPFHCWSVTWRDSKVMTGVQHRRPLWLWGVTVVLVDEFVFCQWPWVCLQQSIIRDEGLLCSNKIAFNSGFHHLNCRGFAFPLTVEIWVCYLAQTQRKTVPVSNWHVKTTPSNCYVQQLDRLC